MKKLHSVNPFDAAMMKLYLFFYKLNQFQKKYRRFGISEKRTKKEEAEKMEEVAMQVSMDCTGCAERVRKCLKGFKGVEEVAVDLKAQTAVAKGRGLAGDATNLVDWVSKKSGKNGRRQVQLLSTSRKEEEEEEKEDTAKEEKEKEERGPENKNEEGLNPKKEVEEKVRSSSPAPAPESYKQEVIKIVTLKVGLHCEDCAQKIKKLILRKRGVQMVETDVKNSTLKAMGVLATAELVQLLARIIKDNNYSDIVVLQEESIFMKATPKEENCDQKKAKMEDDHKESIKVDHEEAGKNNAVLNQKDVASNGGDSAAGSPENGHEVRSEQEYYELKREKMMNALYYYRNSRTAVEEILNDENPNACTAM